MLVTDQIATPRFDLRLIQPADAAALRAVSDDLGLEWIDAKLHHEKTIVAHAIMDRATQEIVGAVQISVATGDEYHFVGLAYWIAPKHQGNGAATEAIQAALGAVTIGQPVYAWVIGENAASARVLEKCGFVPIQNPPKSYLTQPGIGGPRRSPRDLIQCNRSRRDDGASLGENDGWRPHAASKKSRDTQASGIDRRRALHAAHQDQRHQHDQSGRL